MPKKPEGEEEAIEETWPAIIRVGTVARYLDCSTATVNKIIADGLLRAVKYGPSEGMKGIRREDVDAYIESLRPEFDYPEYEFEFSRAASPKPKGPGSRLLWLKAAVKYFRDDRDSWKRRALYTEQHLERDERKLMAQLDHMLPEKLPSSGLIGARFASKRSPRRGAVRPPSNIWGRFAVTTAT